MSKRLYKVEITATMLVMAMHRQEAETVAKANLANRIELNRLKMFTDPMPSENLAGIDLDAREGLEGLQTVPLGSHDHRPAAQILREVQREGGR